MSEGFIRAARLKFATVEWLKEGKIRTTLHADGATCDAVPDTGPHYHVISHRCGYGDDVWRYAYEHEVCHALVAEFFFDSESPVLRGVAGPGKMLSGKEAAAEELMAQTLQRFLRAGERPIIGGVKWDELRERASSLLDVEA